MEKKNNHLKRTHAALKTTKACGFHCIKLKDFGVKLDNDIILEHVNLHIHCGNLIAIIGRNGAGKSTLIKAILNEIPHSGTIEFKNIKEDTFHDLVIGYVPQSINIEKNTPTSVYDLFASYITDVPVFLWKSKKAYDRIKKQLCIFGVEELIDKAVCDLSGGQLQRVLLSIATYPIPNLLILDEPVSGIDQNGMELFYQTIHKLKQNYDLAIILVSHDLEYIRKYADKVVLLDRTVLAEGTPSAVYHSEEFYQIFGKK